MVDNKKLMTEIQLAAQTDAPVTGIIPVTLNLGSLHKRNLIKDTSADKIRALTHCLNLSSIELIYSKGAVTHVDVYPPACMTQS